MLSLPLLIIGAAVVLLVISLVLVLVNRSRSGNEVERFHRARTMTTAWSQSDWQRRVPGRRLPEQEPPGQEATKPADAPAQQQRVVAPRTRTE